MLEHFDGATDVVDVGDELLGDDLLADLAVVSDEGEGFAIVADAFDGAQAVRGDDGVNLAVNQDRKSVV